LQTRESLIAYVERYKSDETLLFADIDKNRIVAVVDYHGKSDTDVPAGKANHGTHVARTDIPYSEEWKIWAAASGSLFPQLKFARFLEENAPDIIAPDAATLLETCRDLQARRKVNFIKAVRTSTNNENFEFTDETEAHTKGGIELPTQFLINIPVYFGEPIIELKAFLRWELVEGRGLMLGVKLWRAEHVRQAEFRRIVTAVTEGTGSPVVYGVLGVAKGSVDAVETGEDDDD
jgi:uncharacterized protein YfdQ (DUF2303 family)